VAKAWRAPCERYGDNNNDLVVACAHNAGAYRPLAIATLFFIFMAIATHARPRFNREAWPAKMMVRFYRYYYSEYELSFLLFVGGGEITLFYLCL
jgi:hypothetical protein